MPKKSVLFVCVENANRSQMAAAFARLHGKDKLDVYSAGSRPAEQINHKAVRAMLEVGYDLTQHRPQSLSEIPDIEYDLLATMGCGDDCPFIRAKNRVDWNIPDPKHMPDAEFIAIRKLIESEVKSVLKDLLD